VSTCDITVLICVFNKSIFLRRCINSVLSQTLLPKKIICINDFSSDRSAEILEEYCKAQPNLFLIVHNNINLGLTSSRNIGLQYVNTRFVAFLDADDYWDDRKLEKQSGFLLSGADFVYNAYKWVTNGKINEDRFSLQPKLAGSSVTAALLEGNLISGSASAVVCSFEKLVKVGYSDRNLKFIANDFGEDWDMWLRLSVICNFKYSEDVLTYLDDSGLYSSGPADVETLIRWFKAHYHIRSKFFSSHKNVIIKWQTYEFNNLIALLDHHTGQSLKDWMIINNSALASQILVNNE